MTVGLLELVPVVAERLGSLHEDRDAPGFAAALRDVKADAFAGLRGGLRGRDAVVASQVIASRTIRELRGMPALVRAMAGELGQEISPESRMLLTMGLAYLVGPVDLVRGNRNCNPSTKVSFLSALLWKSMNSVSSICVRVATCRQLSSQPLSLFSRNA